MKAVKKFRTDDEEKLGAAEHEFNLLKILDHPNIVRVEDIFIDRARNTTFTIMEYIEGEQLQDFIYKNGPLKGKIELIIKS